MKKSFKQNFHNITLRIGYFVADDGEAYSKKCVVFIQRLFIFSKNTNIWWYFWARNLRKRNRILIIRFYKIKSKILNGQNQTRVSVTFCVYHFIIIPICSCICGGYLNEHTLIRAVIYTSTRIRAFFLFIQIVDDFC